MDKIAREHQRESKRLAGNVFFTCLNKILIGLLRSYQLIVSPLFPPSCRFYPTCSSYAIQAVEKYGVCKGSWLSVRRLLKCHPWHAGGTDDLP